MIESPIWNDTPSARYQPCPKGTVRVDVAVVGGGLTGLSTAYHLLLRDPGIRVVVLEAGLVGSGASSRNTGMVGPGVGQDLLGLRRRLGDSGAEALYRETLRAVKLVFDLVAAEHIDCDPSLTGQVYWARSAAGRRRLSTQAGWLSARGLPVELVDDDTLHGYMRLPGTVGQGNGPVALRLPIAGVVDPGKLVAGLACAAHDRGACIFEQSPVSALTAASEGRQVCLSVAGGGKVIADQAVLATAGYTSALGWFRGRVIPLRLQALATEPIPAALLAHIGWSRREGVVETRRIFNYFRLSADNRLIFGGGAPRPCPRHSLGSESVSQRVLTDLGRSVYATFPDLAREHIRITHGWSGTIGYVLDGIPAIGRSRENQRILHALGWSGHGLALGVAAGRWIANLIVGGATGAGDAGVLAWFRSDPPQVPCEPLHGLAVRAGVSAMRILDRVA